jgi:hypothetical protein
MSRQVPAVRTQLLFTGTIGRVLYDGPKQLVTVQMRDDQVTYSKLDVNCNIQSAAIDSAFHSIEDAPLVTLVTPFDLITNIPLTDKKLFTVKHFLGKPHQWIQFTFAGSEHDAAKLRRYTPLQLYAVNLNVPCTTEDHSADLAPEL